MNNNISSKKSIYTRYSLKKINSNKYQQISIIGDNSCCINNNEYVYLPYIIIEHISLEEQKKVLKKLRVDKLNRLNE